MVRVSSIYLRTRGSWERGLYTARLAKPAIYREVGLNLTPTIPNSAGLYGACYNVHAVPSRLDHAAIVSRSGRVAWAQPVPSVCEFVPSIRAHPSATRAGTGKSSLLHVPSVLPHRICCWEPTRGDSNIPFPLLAIPGLLRSTLPSGVGVGEVVAPFEQTVVLHPPIDRLWEIPSLRQLKPGVRHHIPVDVPPIAV